MPVQVISKSHKFLIKTKKVMLRTRSHTCIMFSDASEFYHCLAYMYLVWIDPLKVKALLRITLSPLNLNVYGKNFCRSRGRVTPKWIVRYGQKSKLCETVSLSSLRKDPVKTKRHYDPPYNIFTNIQSNSVMLHIQFNHDWPAGLRDIQGWKCGRRTTEDCYTISSACEPLTQVS